MEERPYIPYTPPTPPKKERKGLKVFGMTMLLLLLAGSASFAALVWVKNNELQTNLAKEQENAKTLASENAKLKSQLEAKAETANITDTLPDGSKITYPDTAGNRNVLWWGAGENQGSIILSHKGLQQYLATVSSETVTKVCGTDEKPKAPKYNISLGMLALATKELTIDSTDNCVSLLASDANTDDASRTAATQALKTANDDIGMFVDSATIEQ